MVTPALISWLPDRHPAGGPITAGQSRQADVIIRDVEFEPKIRELWDKAELIRKTVDTASEPTEDRFAEEAGAVRRRLDELGRQADGKSDW